MKFVMLLAMLLTSITAILVTVGSAGHKDHESAQISTSVSQNIVQVDDRRILDHYGRSITTAMVDGHILPINSMLPDYAVTFPTGTITSDISSLLTTNSASYATATFIHSIVEDRKKKKNKNDTDAMCTGVGVMAHACRSSEGAGGGVAVVPAIAAAGAVLMGLIA